MVEVHEHLPVAAVDLGSNSFHLVVGRLVDGELVVLDKLRDRVALAEGLDAERKLVPEAQERALACLERFGQRLRDMPRGNVRAVGTNTLRRAANADELLSRAESALGHPIDVISGQEEARLIHLAVAHELAGTVRNPLVVDIGGGSTEIALGQGFEVADSESLYMGCVSWSRRFFPDGQLKTRAFEQARLAARIELEPMERRFRDRGWEAAYGSSGTIAAISAILRESGWTDGEITAKGLKRLRKAVLGTKRADQLNLPGLTADRRPVLAGGLAILSAIFDALRLEGMRSCQSALREGLLHDLLGRMLRDDVRDRTITRFVERFRVDVWQSDRVERTALALLDQVHETWGIDLETGRRVLRWASRLHEIGLAIAHPGYHRHGAYLVSESHMPGFSREDQSLLAALVRGHRRKLRPETFARVPPSQVPLARHLCVLLRLAVQLHRSRSRRQPPEIRLEAGPDSLDLRFPEGWLERHPLTRADLEQEQRYLSQQGIKLGWS